MPKNYQKHIDYYRKYNSEYYNLHKHIILQDQATPKTCEICKRTLRKNNYARHVRTAIHYENLKKRLEEQLEEES